MVISIGKALVHGAFLLAGTGIGFGMKMIFDHWKYDTVIPPEDKDGKDAFEKAYAYYKAKKAGVISPEIASNTASNDDIKEYIDKKFSEFSESLETIETLDSVKSMLKYVIGREDNIAKDAEYVAHHMNRICNIEKMCECMTTDQLESIIDSQENWVNTTFKVHYFDTAQIKGDISAIRKILEEVNLIEEEDYVNATGGISGDDRAEEEQDRSVGDGEDADGSRTVIGDRDLSETDRSASNDDIRIEKVEGEGNSPSGDCEQIQGSDRSVGDREYTDAEDDIRTANVEGKGNSTSGGSGRVQSSKEEKEEADGGRIMNDSFEDYDQMPYEESPEDREIRQQQPAYEISEAEYEAESGPGEPYRFKDDDFTYYLRSDILATGNDIQDADEILTPEGHRILRMCDKEMTCYIRLEAIDTDFQIEVLDEEWPGD